MFRLHEDAFKIIQNLQKCLNKSYPTSTGPSLFETARTFQPLSYVQGHGRFGMTKLTFFEKEVMLVKITFQSQAVTLCTIRLNIQRFNILPTECIKVLGTYLRTKRECFQKQHCFYNREMKCLLRGEIWMPKCSARYSQAFKSQRSVTSTLMEYILWINSAIFSRENWGFQTVTRKVWVCLEVFHLFGWNLRASAHNNHVQLK